MEDPFFSAASVDLDKILDDFEERETPTAFHNSDTPNQEKRDFQEHKNLVAQNSVYLPSVSANLSKSNSDEQMKNNSGVLENSGDIESCSNNHDKDLLIDFSSPDVIPTQPQQHEASANVLKDLDFLLSLVPLQSPSSGAVSLPSDTCQSLDLNLNTQNHLISDENEVAELLKNDDNNDNFTATMEKSSKSTINESKSFQKLPVSSTDEVKSTDLSENIRSVTQDTEFLKLMKEELNIPIDVEFENNTEEHHLRDIETTENSSDLGKSPENNDVGQTAITDSNVSGLVTHDAAQSSQNVSSNIVQPNMTSNKEMGKPAVSTSESNRNSVASDVTVVESASVNLTRSEATAQSVSSTQAPGHEVSSAIVSEEVLNNITTSQATPQISQSEEIQSNSRVVAVNQSNQNQANASVSPPSYSSVIAGDYSAGTLIHQDPSMTYSPNSDRRFQQVVQPVHTSTNEQYVESIEHGVEVTEETSTDVIQDSYRGARNRDVHEATPATLPVTLQRPGQVKPRWVPDEESPSCTQCRVKFTFTRRRHHCRACGRVFCSTCCAQKSKLAYLENAEARVCTSCYTSIVQVDTLRASMVNRSDANPLTIETSAAVSQSLETINPRPIVRNPEDGNNASKSVRFSDGTKPDHPPVPPATPPMPTRTSRGNRGKQRSRNNSAAGSRTLLPPIITDYGVNGKYSVEEDPDLELVSSLLDTGEDRPVVFVLSANLFVLLKLVKYGRALCHYFISHGLDSVGQSEVALLLEVNSKSRSLPIEAFSLYSHLFQSARKGKAVHANDYLSAGDFLGSSDTLFGSSTYSGFMFVRRTFQDIKDLTRKPNAESPFLTSISVNFSSTLFALLVRTSEVSWANLFCTRLLLGLGAKYKQFPYPLMNMRDRSPVYFEVANTILGILCDFRNYKYRVVTVPGLSVIVKKTSLVISIPYNRFADLTKIMNSSNEHVLALGSDAFVSDDNCLSHLVCVQNPSDNNYHTEVIASQHAGDPAQSGTGAAFVVFNGSLKTGTTQQAKCTVVEDGVMVQLLPEKMAVLKESLKAMEDFRISCQQLHNMPTETELSNNSEADKEKTSASTSTVAQETLCQSVEVRWIVDDTKFNIGLSSPIDFRSLEGIVGYNVQGKSEKKGKNQILRWNQVFFFKTPSDILDMSRLAERVANGFFQSLVPHVKLLRDSNQIKIGIRVNIHPDDVGYVVGSNGVPLPDDCMNALDDHLVSLLHESSSSLQAEDDPVVFELIFHILDIRSNWKSIQQKPSN